MAKRIISGRISSTPSWEMKKLSAGLRGDKKGESYSSLNELELRLKVSIISRLPLRLFDDA
jgi:hypothetical protein